MKPWRTTEIATLRQLAGQNALRVAACLGRSPRAVQDMARRIGEQVPAMPHGRYWPAGLRLRARDLRTAGRSVAEISQSLGVPVGTVRRWIYSPGQAGARVQA